MTNRWSILFIVAATLLLTYGCAPTVYSSNALLDTPSRHVENGIKMLNAGKVEDAFREFNRAKTLDPNYPPAYVGIGFCYGLRGDYEKGLSVMEEAQHLPKPYSPDPHPNQ